MSCIIYKLPCFCIGGVLSALVFHNISQNNALSCYCFIQSPYTEFFLCIYITDNESQSEVKSQRNFNVSCSEDFVYDESSLVCKPKCGVWTPLSPEANKALLVLSVIGQVASVAICSAILVLSIVQYKRT